MSSVRGSQRSNAKTELTYLPMAAWPTRDRAAWDALFAEGDVFDEGGSERHWALATRRTNAHHYARWLGWLRAKSALDVCALPWHRVTPDAVEAYARHLIECIAPRTVASSLIGLKVVMKAMAPGQSWRWLMDLTNRLHVWAKPTVDRRAAIQSISDIYRAACRELDLRLATPLTRRIDRVAYRDALAVALLAACPVRLRNLAMIQIGVHLVVEDRSFALQFGEHETKNGQRLAYVVPSPLVPYLQVYLDCVRPSFAPRDQTQALWLGFEGQPLTAHSLYGRIVSMTERWFGQAINPHLFRTCAATSLTEVMPDKARLAAPLLGHLQFTTTERFYLRADSIEAGRKVGAVLNSLRAENRESPAS